MADYIDREALIKTTRETPFTMSMCLTVEECKGMNSAREILADIFEILPAADVAPVVRCKDCKIQQCCKISQYLGTDGFCSNGEKADETIEEPDDNNLEIGFDPYLGCYTDDC